MAAKYINKTVVSTTVNGFKLGEDGTPEPAQIFLAGRYKLDAATKIVHKEHDKNFMVTGVEHAEESYKIRMSAFIAFAKEYTDKEREASENDSGAASDVPAEDAPAPAKRGKK